MREQIMKGIFLDAPVLGEFDDDTRQCIADCQRCHNDCLQAMAHAMLHVNDTEKGRDRVALLLNCAEMCQATANAMLHASPWHAVMCEACGEICEACADLCAPLADLDECTESCRLCADSCLEMARDCLMREETPASP